jgi:hypothetical protein
MHTAAAAPRLLYSVPSLGFDESNGPPTFVFVTHQLTLEKFPYSFPEDTGFFISNGWLGAPGVYQQRIELYKPSGELLVESGQRPLELIRENIPYMAVTFFMGVTFEAPGEHTIVVSVDGDLRVSYPFHVVGVPNQDQEALDGYPE